MTRRRCFALVLMGILTMFVQSANATTRDKDLTVTVSGIEIPCRLTQPQRKPRGALLLLPGSLYSDVDGNYPAMNLRPHLYADLARQLGDEGFVVLRMAKVGPGTGSRTLDPAEAQRHVEFGMRVEVAAAGLALLQEQTTARPLLVAGHSEGALVASLLASSPSGELIEGVVSLSGPAQVLLDLMRDQMRQMMPPGVATDFAVLDATIAAIRAGERPPEAAASDPHSGMLASMGANAHRYLRSVDAVDPMAALRAVRQPVLIVQGGRDASVPASHAAQLKAARGDAPTRLAEFPTLTHFYKVAPPDLPPMQSMALDSDSDPAVAKAISQWALNLEDGQAVSE